MLEIMEWSFFLRDFKSVHVYECNYSIEMELNTVLQAAVYINTTHLQYTLCTVLLTVWVTALKQKLVTELVAATERTFTNHTQFKELSCCWRVSPPCTVQLSADSVLCFFVITSSGAEWNRKSVSVQWLFNWHLCSTLEHCSCCDMYQLKPS